MWYRTLEAEIKRLGEEAVTRERELDKVRDTFSRDIEKLRETASRAEERLRASEKRALLEIDRERGAVVKAQKELAETAKRAEKRDEEHRHTVESAASAAGRCAASGWHTTGQAGGAGDRVRVAARRTEVAAWRGAHDDQARPSGSIESSRAASGAKVRREQDRQSEKATVEAERFGLGR
jgi:hypothetical protein